ncbi:MAG: hypothetical protein FJZ01_00585 [Candidatus Sericytochromatia bacterium]|nr:hypothetical protein [Candidatus Tanganyikabacteria bacterium]
MPGNLKVGRRPLASLAFPSGTAGDTAAPKPKKDKPKTVHLAKADAPVLGTGHGKTSGLSLA